MRTTRFAAAFALALAGVLLSACATSESGEPALQSKPAGPSSLASFDPCTVLSPEEVAVYGAIESPEQVDQGLGETGCAFLGEDFSFRVYKAEGQGMDYWESQRSNFVQFTRN